MTLAAATADDVYASATIDCHLLKKGQISSPDLLLSECPPTHNCPLYTD